MRYALAVVLAVVFAGYLERPFTATESFSASEATLDPFFPRALKAAQSWRAEAVPARVVGDATFAPPPRDVPQTEISKGRAGDGGGEGDATYAFVDPATRDVLVVEVDEDTVTLHEFPAARPDTGAASPLDTLLGDLLDGGGDATRPGAPSKAASPEPLASTPSTGCDGWWLCLKLRLAAWWG